MKKREKPVPPPLEGLRAIAEERLRETEARATPAGASEQDEKRLVHELQVHQIELEMQNKDMGRTQRELDESRLLYEDLFESAPVGYFTLDGLGTVLRANLTAAGLLGVPRSRLLGARLGIYLAESNRLAFASFLADVMAGKSAGPCAATLTRENGEQVFVLLVGTADPAGSTCKVVMTDVTRLKVTEEMLRRSETEVHKLESDLRRQIVETTTRQEAAEVTRDATEVTRDAAEVTRDAAEVARDAAEVTRDAAKGKRDATKGERDAAKDERDAAKDRRDAAKGERDAAKGKRDAARGERDAAKEQLLHLWKARVVQLEAANRELDAFSYSVAHDLRSPVRAIDGFARLLEDRIAGSLDEESQRLLTVVRKNSLRMGHLIDDLLTYARAARNDIRIEDIDMARLVSEILPEVLPEERRSQVEVRVATLPLALGDRALVRQAVLNLLANAVKFAGPKAKPVIEIGSRRTKGVVEYFVRDNGVGFDMKYVGKLFGVFQRLHSEKDFPGTGIGLSLVRRIVERHGGQVRAEGVVGEGATFYFTLRPASTGATTEATA